LLAVATVGIMLAMMPTSAKAGPSDAFDHTFGAIEGGQMPLAQWRGKVLLVVNTASFCGYTRQYEGLQALWERYRERGLVVIGVPSNDFGGQEPKAEPEILGFCKGAFGVTFPLAAKEVVSGPRSHPFYRWALGALGNASGPRWNFHKYLVGRDGRLVAGYASGVEPGSAELTRAIETALAAP
jgi:glutathione peroxidase